MSLMTPKCIESQCSHSAESEAEVKGGESGGMGKESKRGTIDQAEGGRQWCLQRKLLSEQVEVFQQGSTGQCFIILHRILRC